MIVGDRLKRRFGFAIKTKQFSKYDAQKWLAFYERGLRRVLEINRQGTPFREFYAALLLTRMLSDRPIGYVDLRSPAGAGLGALVYNYDGSVFASDEGRMLAETGDDAFRLGHVEHDSYNSLILSDKLIGAISSSLGAVFPPQRSVVLKVHPQADQTRHRVPRGRRDPDIPARGARCVVAPPARGCIDRFRVLALADHEGIPRHLQKSAVELLADFCRNLQ
ncbi:hypothetical protein [Bradyrhizobium sp. 187]|uniref:hypothetical protein n=1 Tax=Bradyrhizobium sp. 187 TaxID=2782655 RepID=UPI001FFEA3CB|nr:hypothetical protein [Bradyrhizobium sp. 187]